MMGNVYIFYHLEVIRSALHNFWHYYPGLFMSFAIRYTRSLISLFEWQIRRVRLNGKKRMTLATFFTRYKIIIFSKSESVFKTRIKLSVNEHRSNSKVFIFTFYCVFPLNPVIFKCL